MDKLEYVKGILLLGLLLGAGDVLSVGNTPVQINNYVIPAVFANALQQGMNVPVFIRYDGDKELNRSQQKIADAVLAIKDGSFLINQLTLNELPERTELSPQLKTHLTGLKEKSFGVGTLIHLDDNASISLDTKSFYLELTVSREAMAAAIIPRINMLGHSSAENVSNVLNYTVGSYYNKLGDASNTSSYITLDSTTAWQEHHVNLNGSVYGISTPDQKGELYRAMYEHDFQGYRGAAGMVDTWNLQSIASMNALNSSRIYGVTYGNKNNTQIEDTRLSLIPITVFLPAAGEVYVYRDGKLLSIQSFSMGSYEIDTSRLPFGVYNVDVQVMVNGKVVNSRTTQINKTFARKSSVTGDVSWQMFGGMLEYSKMDYREHHNIDHGKKETWISGVAVATRQPWLSGVDLKSTLYGFDKTGINETEANITFNDMLVANQQTLVATDKSWQSISTLNVNVPGGYASFWGAREFSHIGDKLPTRKGDYFSLGATANLMKFSPYLGTLSVSRTENKYFGNKYTTVDYSQSLFSSRYASVSLRTGIQRYYYDDRQGVNDKYVNIDVSLPLSAWFSTGVSSENGNMRANATLRKSFDDSVVTQVGAAISKRIKNKNDGGYHSDNYAANGYVSYDAKYNAGTVSVIHTSDRNSNLSFNSQGSLAWTKDNFAVGKGTQSSGVVVNTNFSEKGKMVAQINGRNYPLTGKSNYISLPPYAEYKVEMMNDQNSEDSVDIVSGRRSQLVLYPGNVGVINPEIKQLVTVFGRVRKPGGEIYANTDIHNHIGKARTDEYGEFAMDIDKRYPVITLLNARGGICETDLDLRNARGAVWIGDIQCDEQNQTTSRAKGGNKNVY